MVKQTIIPEEYAAGIATQLRKGFLAYCVLKVCSSKAVYTSDIIKKLHSSELIVVEGTIYPLLGKLHKDGLLEHDWKESGMGPPRKYYKITDYGREVLLLVTKEIDALNATLQKL